MGRVKFLRFGIRKRHSFECLLYLLLLFGGSLYGLNLDELNDCHLGTVATTGTHLKNGSVTAIYIRISGCAPMKALTSRSFSRMAGSL